MDINNRNDAHASRRFSNTEALMRTYSYNSDVLQHLFARIIKSLGASDNSGESIGFILNEVCRHFRFGCGFIYEADHTETLHLRERFANYTINNLPDSFKLPDYLREEDIRELMGTAFLYHHRDSDTEQHTQGNIFDSNTYMLVPIANSDGSLLGLVGMLDRRRNILLDEQAVEAARTVLNLLVNSVKLRIYQRNLEYAGQTLVNILDNTGIDIYVNDFNTHEILYVNKSMAAPYGGREKMLGKKCWKSIYSDKSGPCEYCPQKQLIDEDGNPTKVYSWDYRRPFDGSWFRVLSAAFRWMDGRLAHVVSSVDITENKTNEATIARMANFDALTNLPNRRKLMADCQTAIENALENGTAGYLLFFDLDKFKHLNDTMGHQAGDELLKTVADALQTNTLTQNRCYRYGGDEFIVLLQDTSAESVDSLVRFILERFTEPWHLSSASPVCKASIGVAEFPANGNTPDEVLHNADMMMYKAKQDGGGKACFFDGRVITIR